MADFFCLEQDKIACEFEKEADVSKESKGGKRDREINRQPVWQRGDSKKRRGREEKREETPKIAAREIARERNLVVLFVKTHPIFNRAEIYASFQ